MGWLNSDDLHFPWTLRTIAHVFNKFPEVEWLTSLMPCLANSQGCVIESDRKRGFARKYFRSGLYMDVPGRQLLGFIQQESTFWRSRLYESAGGIQDSFRLAGDFDLWARYFDHSELHGISCMLGIFRRHREQLTRQFFDQYLREACESLSSVGGALCHPIAGWLQIQHMKTMANWPQFKCPSFGLVQPVNNINWDMLHNEWKMDSNWI